MINGLHSHYCLRHKKDIECAQVTHCRKEPTSLCADCLFDDYKRKEQEEAEKDWPSVITGNKKGDTVNGTKT